MYHCGVYRYNLGCSCSAAFPVGGASSRCDAFLIGEGACVRLAKMEANGKHSTICVTFAVNVSRAWDAIRRPVSLLQAASGVMARMWTLTKVIVSKFTARLSQHTASRSFGEFTALGASLFQLWLMSTSMVCHASSLSPNMVV